MTAHDTGTKPGDFHDQPWSVDALCAQTDPDAFFPDKGGSTREPKAVCQSCTVREQCLSWAIDTDQRFGVWGGLSERERRPLRKQQPDLAATGTDTPAAAVDEQDRPAPRSYGGTYVAGTGARPIPLATDITTRRPHTPRKPRPTGLDWSKHTAPEPEQTPAPVQLRCRWCRQPATDLEHDLCARCRDDATQRFQTPDTTVLGRDLADLERTDPEVAAAAASYDDMVARVTQPEDHVQAPEMNQIRADVTPPADVVDTVRQHLCATRATLAAELARIDQALALIGQPVITPPPAPVAATSTPTPVAATGNQPPTPPRRRPRPSNSFDLTKARSLLEQGHSVPQIATQLGVATSTARRHLKDAGVPIPDGRSAHSGGRNQITAYPDQLVADVRRLYLDEQLNQQQVASRIGVSVTVIQRVMARHDIPARPSATDQPRPQPKKLDDPAVLDQLVARYQAGESANALAKAYGVSQPTVLARLRDRGVTIRGRGSRGGATT